MSAEDMIENYQNLSVEKGNIINQNELLDNTIFLDNTKSRNESIKCIEKESHRDAPFEYGSGYGYLHTRLKWILDNYEVSGQFKTELYSLLETLGELRVLGVYNESYKKYRKAFDIFSMKFVSSDKYNEDIIGDLRYQCYQSSASGRKELKIIDKSIKEWSKRDRENKLIHSCRGAMSEWLNRSEFGVNKIERQIITRENVFNEMVNSSKDIIPLQQSQILSYLSSSYISEKLFPFMVGQVINSTSAGTFPCGVFGESLKSETPNLSGSRSSIDLGGGNDGDEIVATSVDVKSNSNKSESVLGVVHKSNENSLNIKVQQNESVMSWIKNNFNRKQDTYNENSEHIFDGDTDLIRKERMKQISSDKENIISQRLSKRLCDIGKDISIPSLLDKDIILKEYFRCCISIYEIFISLRENLYNQRKYYKSIPTIGSVRSKRQEIGIEEAQTRQFQSIYNDGIVSESLNKIRRVLIYRSEWKRPPMYLLVTHKGRQCKGNNPLAKEDHINYDIDTDEEWEEQFGGEDVENVDDIPDACDEDDDNDAVASGWLVPDGCFQSDELLEEFTIGNSANEDGTSIVNILSFSSQYPSPVVISFLNHTSIDFGLGISVPSDEYVNSVLKGYSIRLTQDSNWIYNKTDASKYCNISLVETNCHLVSSASEISNTKKNVLDLQLKQKLSYFIHGKWASIRKIIDEFIEINNYKDIKKSLIVQFIKENVSKAKLAGDARSRWHVNENATHLELDSSKLSELLAQRKAEEKNISNRVESAKNRQARSCLQTEPNIPVLQSQIQFSGSSQNSNSDRKGKRSDSFKISSDIYPEYSMSNKSASENDENNNMNSQCSMKSMNGVLNISSSQGSEQSSINSQAVEKEVHSGIENSIKKRKFPTPIRDMSFDHTEHSSFNREKKGDGIDGFENVRINTPESKNYTHIQNNSLITHFFPPRSKG